jgi:undecaprenyl-diphosphatase
VPLFVVATFALWLLDRPGSRYRWKIACLSGLTSAGLGLLISQVITQLWVRDRPFVAHSSQTLLLVPPSHEPSFPSDHAVAAFAIGFSVAIVGGRRLGALFLAAASMVAITRVFVGLHYPGDVAGGALIGLLAALIVCVAGGNRWSPIVTLISRLTDPIVAPAWRTVDSARAKRRLHSSSRSPCACTRAALIARQRTRDRRAPPRASGAPLCHGEPPGAVRFFCARVLAEDDLVAERGRVSRGVDRPDHDRVRSLPSPSRCTQYHQLLELSVEAFHASETLVGPVAVMRRLVGVVGAVRSRSPAAGAGSGRG